MKEFTIDISEQRIVTNRYSIKAESLEAVKRMSILDILGNADFVEWVGDTEEDSASMTIDDIEEIK